MPVCECLEGCHYFKNPLLQDSNSLTELRKIQYCKGNFQSCARYIVFRTLGAKKVPQDLIPSDEKKAKELIEKSYL